MCMDGRKPTVYGGVRCYDDVVKAELIGSSKRCLGLCEQKRLLESRMISNDV